MVLSTVDVTAAGRSPKRAVERSNHRRESETRNGSRVEVGDASPLKTAACPRNFNRKIRQSFALENNEPIVVAQKCFRSQSTANVEFLKGRSKMTHNRGLSTRSSRVIWLGLPRMKGKAVQPIIGVILWCASSLLDRDPMTRHGHWKVFSLEK